MVDWFKIRTKPEDDTIYLAQFYPKNEKVQLPAAGGGVLTINGDPDVDHGKGDFLVIPMDDYGRPDYGNIRKVNGVSFARTYSRTGWPSECFDSKAVNTSITKADLPKIVNIGSGGPNAACELFALYGMTAMMDEPTKALLLLHAERSPIYMNHYKNSYLFGWQDKSSKWHVCLQKENSLRSAYTSEGSLKKNINDIVKFLDESAAYLRSIA